MYLLFKNHIFINNLRELSINSSKVLNQIRCLAHLNSNQQNSGICLKSNQNNRICLQNVFNLNLSQSLRTFKTTNSQMKPLPENYSSFDLLDGIVARIRRKLGFTSVQKSIFQNSSVYIYEACTDGIDIEKFFKHLNLRNTYLSWFLVTQLHVWSLFITFPKMCMTRAMSEGKEGRVLRNEITARMWDDSQERLKVLTHQKMYLPLKVKKQGMDDLLMQFQAAIFAYDEGLLSDDKTLAAALWRTLFTFEELFEEVDPQSIETMVSYVRTQFEHLQTIGTEFFFYEGKIVWKDFPPLYP